MPRGSLVETRHYYYNDQWQVVEERVGADGDSARVDAQYVWHPHYVDALAMRYWDSDATGGPDTRHYYLQDANYNVTALVDAGGDAVERYHYTPYGEVTFLNAADFSVKETQVSAVKNVNLYTGRERDPETGLQLNRQRYYAAHLGRWVSRDPIGYEGSQWNLFEYVTGDPVSLQDASGLVANGCGAEGGPKVPDGYVFCGRYVDFKPSCDAHDNCYGRCGVAKSRCDKAFLQDMFDACIAATESLPLKCAVHCSLYAAAYYDAVYGGGGDAFAEARKHCLPPPPFIPPYCPTAAEFFYGF